MQPELQTARCPVRSPPATPRSATLTQEARDSASALFSLVHSRWLAPRLAVGLLPWVKSKNGGDHGGRSLARDGGGDLRRSQRAAQKRNPAACGVRHYADALYRYGECIHIPYNSIPTKYTRCPTLSEQHLFGTNHRWRLFWSKF